MEFYEMSNEFIETSFPRIFKMFFTETQKQTQKHRKTETNTNLPQNIHEELKEKKAISSFFR